MRHDLCRAPFPVPGSRFPVPGSRFPVPGPRLPAVHTSAISTGSPVAADWFAAMLTASDFTPSE